MYHTTIITQSQDNQDFRHVIHTTELTQLVLMMLQPQEDIGLETHAESDQIFFFVDGTGQANVDGSTVNIQSQDLLVVPAGSQHNIINTSDTPLKFFTIYAPPTHPDGTIHHTKQDALE